MYEDSGKALAISILDLTESNPWTRLTCSACKNLRGVREAIRKYIKQNEETAAAKQKAAEAKTAAAAASSQEQGSPTRRGRRLRSAPLSAPKTPRKGSAKAAAGVSSGGAALAPLGGSGKSPPLKAPSSPDSYRPVTKIPRKNSQGVKQSSKKEGHHAQGGVGLQRSRSIPAVAAPSDLFRGLHQTEEPSYPQQQLPPVCKKKAVLTRSRSNPGSGSGAQSSSSRPQSPKRSAKARSKSAKGKKKSTGASSTGASRASASASSASASRKNSDASLSVASTSSCSTNAPDPGTVDAAQSVELSSGSSVSPSRKKKLAPVGLPGAKKKKRRRKPSLPK